MSANACTMQSGGRYCRAAAFLGRCSGGAVGGWRPGGGWRGSSAGGTSALLHVLLPPMTKNVLSSAIGLQCCLVWFGVLLVCSLDVLSKLGQTFFGRFLMWFKNSEQIINSATHLETKKGQNVAACKSCSHHTHSDTTQPPQSRRPYPRR